MLQKDTRDVKTIPDLTKWNFKSINLIPMGILVTLPISYIFLQDAITKFTIIDKLSLESFGEYAIFSDISLSVSWVIVSSFAWDFAPLAQKTTTNINKILIRKICWIIFLGFVVTSFLYLIKTEAFRGLIDIRFNLKTDYLFIFANHLIAGILSSLIFVGLILEGLKRSSLFISILSLSSLFLVLRFHDDNMNFIINIFYINSSILFISMMLLFFKPQSSQHR
jgi:hypothetical protein